jgi:hypothetical protein
VTQIDKRNIWPSTGYVFTELTLSIFGKSGFPSPGLINTKLTGRISGAIRKSEMKILEIVEVRLKPVLVSARGARRSGIRGLCINYELVISTFWHLFLWRLGFRDLSYRCLSFATKRVLKALEVTD